MQLDENYSEFMKLYSSAMPAVRAMLRNILPGWEDVDEVMQQTSLVLWKKFEEFETGTSFTSWACVVARYEALRYKRDKARDKHVFSDELIEILAEETDRHRRDLEQETKALQSCLQKLPENQRRLTLSAYSGDKNIKEVAELFGRTATAMYKALNRIRTNLLKCIKTEMTQS